MPGVLAVVDRGVYLPDEERIVGLAEALDVLLGAFFNDSAGL